MSQITAATIAHIAKLARIDLTPEETETYAIQLATVMEHVARINKIDTSSIAPTFQVTSNSSSFQTSPISSQTLSSQSVLNNAPRHHENYIVTQPSIAK
ncbi:MAG: Asp-tRNA(Asn)/Glu-tRNA(Gln) amidotransferase subunit GatC [Candidatus Shapirobacteria bacterium]|jgi:aspartyl-tRNA(Asn)/glutamyl-tRNA(Gln) amidotransferase subunit C